MEILGQTLTSEFSYVQPTLPRTFLNNQHSQYRMVDGKRSSPLLACQPSNDLVVGAPGPNQGSSTDLHKAFCMAIQARRTGHGICGTPITYRDRVDIVIGWLCDEEGRMKRAQRNARGCVRLDRRRGTWNYLYYDQGKRRSRLIGNRQQYPTKATAWKAAEAFRSSLQPTNRSTAPTVQTLVN